MAGKNRFSVPLNDGSTIEVTLPVGASPRHISAEINRAVREREDDFVKSVTKAVAEETRKAKDPVSTKSTAKPAPGGKQIPAPLNPRPLDMGFADPARDYPRSQTSISSRDKTFHDVASDKAGGIARMLGADEATARRVGEKIAGALDITPYGSLDIIQDRGKDLAEGRGSGSPIDSLAALDVIPPGAAAALKAAAPAGKSALAMFLGRYARNADNKMFDKALGMERMGADPQTIWNETGWNKQHGDWQFEISDKPMQINEMAIPEKPGEAVFLSDVVSHPELEENYPEFFDNVTVGRETNPDYSGSFNYRTQRLLVDPNSPDDLDSIFAHELQHGVSHYENWPVGGFINTPADFSDPEYLFWKGAVADELKEMDRLYSAGDYEGYERARIRMNANTERMMKEGQPGEQYHDVADEVKARNVEYRLRGYNDKDLKTILPQDTQDVPDEFQYIQYPRQRFIWKGNRLLNPSVNSQPTKTPFNAGSLAPRSVLFGFEKDPLAKLRGY